MVASLSRNSPIESSTQQQALLKAYERLLECSEKMLKLACAADWEALIELQSSYLAEVEMLHHFDDEQMMLEQWAIRRKAELLKQLLERDQAIRQRLMDRRRELTRMIQGSRQQLALSRTYSYYQGTSEVIEAAQRFSST